MVSFGRCVLVNLAVVAIAALAVTPAVAAAKPKKAPRAHLAAFDSCQALVGYAHRYAGVTGGGVGVPVRALGSVPTLAEPVMKTTEADADSAPVPLSAPAASGTGTSTPEFSTTNVQEAGIDEPDVVKTDGRHVYVAAGQQLRVIDVTGDAPRQVGSLTLGGGYAHQLLIRGTRALILSTVSAPMAIDVAPAPQTGTARAAISPIPGRSTVLLTEVDLTDPTAPKVARTMTLDGDYVDARMVDGTVRVVVSSSPITTGDVPLTGAPLRTFVPTTTIRSQISHRTFRRSVVPCDDVRRPDAFSGLGLLTVLTVDLNKGLYNVDRDAVMAGAQTVYGSDKSLYVASQRYVRGLDDAGDVPGGAGSLRTEIHRFDASTPGQTTYAGSGTVPGFVVNAYALSEQDGNLRVASTDEPSWLPEGGQATPAHSYVTVLSPRPDGALAQVGQVGGLGEGQRIYGVRFVGTTGYVVTFRQTDPLYTIDLSKPQAPRLVGELEIPGYSAYLHPLGDGLLLGIGQEADATGRTQGTQVSLFDVSDLAHPKRTQHVVYGNGSSDAEFDPHAFLWWAPTQTAVLPLRTYEPTGGESFVGAIGLKVTAGGIGEIGRTVHGSADAVAPIARSLVIEDRLYTLSALGLQASRLDTLAPVAFVAFDG
jgi:uncharacterized secreted protein with C-terminal beta-propeller domain